MRGFDSKTTVGRILRLPLRLLPPTAVVPVVSGPIKGMKWIVGSTPHGAWLGTLERAKLTHLASCLRTGMVVWDIGSHVGLFALASARAVGPTGRVYAFEPIQRNVKYLRQHVSLNHLSNVMVVEAAVDEKQGMLRMAAGDSYSEYHADEQGDLEVPCIALDLWQDETNSPPPDVVKIDVEGAEDAVLRGGARTFASCRPTIYVALHGERQREQCGALLVEWGYRLFSMEEGLGVEESSEWLAEPVLA